jgi:bifunctional UDP-N-acetylglucosamine pyrophosphorylase/glucosamine-1-phosphate N-acetyltransferase
MFKKNKKIKILILAAGRGKRMESDLPKALSLVKGRPMIKYLLESIEKSGVCDKPCIIVGYGRDLMTKELGDKYDYAIQEEQLGTGHAVMCAEKNIQRDTDYVMIFNGDQPLASSETIKKIANKHFKSKSPLTMATTTVPDFYEWRSAFYKCGRIIRDKDGRITKIIEFKDADEKTKDIREINPMYFCFDAKWILKELKNLKNNNAQKEYYLTDLIKKAAKDQIAIETIEIEPREMLGANTKEELLILENFIV